MRLQMNDVAESKLRLLKAAPYEIAGRGTFNGKIHAFRDAEKTFCGQTVEFCPGKVFSGTAQDVTCRICTRSMASQERYDEQREEWKQRAAQDEQRRELEHQRWWDVYSRTSNRRNGKRNAPLC